MSIEMEKFFEEIRYNDNLTQMIRGLMFWIIETDESRDRKALVVLAEYGKKWAESGPPRLVDDAKEFFINWCNEIIEAGSKSDGPEMPGPWKVSLVGL